MILSKCEFVMGMLSGAGLLGLGLLLGGANRSPGATQPDGAPNVIQAQRIAHRLFGPGED